MVLYFLNIIDRTMLLANQTKQRCFKYCLR